MISVALQSRSVDSWAQIPLSKPARGAVPLAVHAIY
jgi:hypothetical protein